MHLLSAKNLNILGLGVHELNTEKDKKKKKRNCVGSGTTPYIN